MSLLNFPSGSPGQVFPSISTDVWQEPGALISPNFRWDSTKKVWSKSNIAAIPEGQKLIAYPTEVNSNSSVCLLWDAIPEEPTPNAYKFRRYSVDLTNEYSVSVFLADGSYDIRGASTVSAGSYSMDVLIFFAIGILDSNTLEFSPTTYSNLVLVRS